MNTMTMSDTKQTFGTSLMTSPNPSNLTQMTKRTSDVSPAMNPFLIGPIGPKTQTTMTHLAAPTTEAIPTSAAATPPVLKPVLKPVPYTGAPAAEATKARPTRVTVKRPK